MISELSAGCECRLFGTGLVMSENAPDCTQNAAYRDRKLKNFLFNFLARGTAPSSDPSPLGRGTPLPKPHSLGDFGSSILGAYGASILALDLLPLHFHHLPPYLTLLATGLYQSFVPNVKT